MPSGAGLEWRSGVVRPGFAVQFHVHPGPHVLVTEKMMMVDTKDRGTIRLMPASSLLIYAQEEHRLWVEHEPSAYTCVGIEGRI